MGLYYEDFFEGQEFITPARTITETDVVQFAGLSGDYNVIHTDEEFSKNTRFGSRIAHGLLGVSVVTGLMARTGIFEGTAVALLGIDKWRFLKPILIGDTVSCRIVIRGKRLTSNKHYGIIFRDFELKNQRGELVQTGSMNVMVLAKGE
ncbi:MAG: MaoC family dehydratase N-terminal domain-containing protein [Alicyclobacillus macrosporangiidus]|uniref:MaoC/PaaZ C-terminal domain-containing protein n=1 Tax=Alicyclobacillus macrosporangiidus TaxID=392015 RepID=UPI0026EEF331|nr:MaoC/PaaZ C-terminal domain-containing protein [Alicyclobacillus macrosporangiidus]MCL6597481.1 MaoC family dehydratase N-terminal domain-containing protein [Alicyclobacillus macrosporangiidus]